MVIAPAQICPLHPMCRDGCPRMPTAVIPLTFCGTRKRANSTSPSIQVWYNIAMKMTRKPSTKQKKSESRGFKLGRAQFAKISAVEGMRLSEQMIS